MSQEELTQALECKDWDTVLKEGAFLCNSCNGDLRDASRLAVDTALFVLEHPEVQSISSDLSKIVRDRLP